MRVIAEIPHPSCKISIFYMNQKYIVKLEKGNLEQVFKISEFDHLVNEEEVKKIIDAAFIEEVVKRFEEMNRQLAKSLENY
jgi:hypothetical protein